MRLSFEHLLQIALAGRKLKRAYVVGSIPPEQKSVWDRLEQATGVKPELFERGQFSGGEQGLDQCLQVHMLRAISDHPDPHVVVLMTGDGAGYDDGVGFHADMARMHAAGWGIEVVTWESSCRRALREWAQANGVFVRLEDFYESVTFIEDGRRSKPVNVSGRKLATSRLTPAQTADLNARLELEKKLTEMAAELEALKQRRQAKDVGRANYQKRIKRKSR